MTQYARIVLAIVETVAQAHNAPTSSCALAASFLLAQQSRMPDYLRLPIGLLTWLFAYVPLLFRGRTFLGLTDEQRIKHLASWKQGRLAVCRDFIRLYEGLAVFALLAEMEGTAARPAEVGQPATGGPA